MRDPSLDDAIRAATGDVSPVYKIDVSQSTSSNWRRIPSDETDAARAREYALFATLLRRPPDSDLLARLTDLEGDSSALGSAHRTLAKAASAANVELVQREFFDLFIGVGRGELLPYASYYLTGFLNDRPLAKLRDDLARLGIERVVGEVEPEDHAAILCDIIARLIGETPDNPAGADREVFDKHLSPWIDRFFADMERAKSADFYRHLATVGRVFMAIETEAFKLAP
jgi:TorA maturation chaperone TorD